jgi:hypothetical protein
MRSIAIPVFTLLLAACAVEARHTTVQVPVPAPAAPSEHAHAEEAPAPRVSPEQSGRVLILQGRRLDRPSEVVGVVDAHVPMGRHDDAMQVLRDKAAALGADAVIGVEFHHGESKGEPVHLSGLAVRFLDHQP